MPPLVEICPLYEGSVTGDMMRLSVRLTEPDTLVGTFVLSRDTAGRVMKFLVGVLSS